MRKLILALYAIITMTASAQTLPYQNPQLTAEQRADDLLARLTLDEKVKLMMDTSPAIPRLGIPQFQWWNEALHGVGRNGFATVFPITMAMAASWDDALVHTVFTAVSDEARVKAQQAKRSGNIQRYQSLSFWTPNINIFRDPRWGRGQETYGEDPYLTTKMGLAVVRGLQGYTYEGQQITYPSPLTPHPYKKLLACAKHFAVHSGPEWNRHTFNIENLPERDLWETYLPAFKALVQEGDVAEVMCAYQRIDGQACCAQSRYEQQILRDEWGFKGLICSDCGAIRDFLPKWHNVAKDGEQASAKAVLSGTDVECGSIYKNLPAAIKRGDIKESDLDMSLRRLLVARFELGDFDADELNPWTKIPERVVASKEHKQLALDMARKSIVLLKNSRSPNPSPKGEGNRYALPLSSDERIVVMGPNANDSTMLWGNYSGRPAHTITILEGIRNRVGAENVLFIDGCGYASKNIRTESRFFGFGAEGLQATIWDNTDMKGTPVAHRYFKSPINFNLNEAGFIAPGVARENFSVQLHGTFHAPETETLQFRIAGDDGFRLIIDGDTLINEWRDQGTLYRDCMVNLEQGRDYHLQIDYFQAGGGAELQFDVNRYRELSNEEILGQVPADASTVIFVGGISSRLEGEEMSVNEPGFRGGDREDIQLPQHQRNMLAALHRMGKRVIFVNCSGSAIAMEPELQTCDAILQAWYAGEQGGTAVAEALFGDINPSGKLPVTFYRSVRDLPDFEDYRMANRTYRYFRGQPLFPFGYGLSYTTFAIGKATVKNRQLFVPVKNTGQRAGTEVVQLYVRSLDDPDGPIRSLKGFARVTLQPGERQTVALPLTDEVFERFDSATNTMRSLPGRYQLLYGTSSADAALQTMTYMHK